MSGINADKLKKQIAQSIYDDVGVTSGTAEMRAGQFVESMEKEFPAWFEPEVIDVADFVESQLSTASDDIQAVADEMIHRYRWDLDDHRGDPKNEYHQGALFGSFYSLLAFARLWDDRPDFERVPKVAPFVQA